MKKYQVEYKKLVLHYTAEKLAEVARDYGVYDIQDDHDFLHVAVKHFCFTHFMYGNAAHLDTYDAKTRGCLFQDWQYQPNGTFKGWISAKVA